MSARASKLELETRLDKVEELLLTGFSNRKVEALLSQEYGVTARQARRYIEQAQLRWKEQSTREAPYRHERRLRRLDHHYLKMMAKGEYTCATQTLAQMAKCDSAFNPHDAEHARQLEALGPPPANGQNLLPYMRRLLAIEIWSVASNQALDPERRLRWIAELSAKTGMIYARSEVEEQLQLAERAVYERQQLPAAAEVVDASLVERPGADEPARATDDSLPQHRTPSNKEKRHAK